MFRRMTRRLVLLYSQEFKYFIQNETIGANYEAQPASFLLKMGPVNGLGYPRLKELLDRLVTNKKFGITVIPP